MYKHIVLLPAILLSISVNAQKTGKNISTANYELASRFSPGKTGKMVFSTSVTPNWLKTSGRFWYTYSTPDSKRWVIVDPVKRTKTDLFDNADLAAKLSVITEDPHESKHLELTNIKFADDERTMRFQVASKKEVVKSDKERKKLTNKSDTLKKKTFYLEYNFATRQLTELADSLMPKKDLSWASFSPDTSVIVFAKGFNLFWMDRVNYRKAQEDDKDSTIVEHALTSDGVKFYEWGGGYSSTADTTDESRVMKERRPARILWSPNGRYFVLTRRDKRDLKNLWVIDNVGGKRPILETYKYQMPGEPDSARDELYIFDFRDKSHKQIDVSAFKNQTVQGWSAKMPKAVWEDEPRLLKWIGDDESFYAYRESRDEKRIDFLRIHVDGRVEVLVEERSNVYLDVKRPEIIDKTGEIVWWSERDGWGHLYLLDKSGKLKNQITRGEYFVSGIEGITGRTLYFVANGKEKDQDPYYDHIYSVSLDGGTPKLLNPGNFDNQVSTNDAVTFYVNNFSRVNTIPASDLYDVNGNKLMNLETADLSQLFAAGYKFPEPFKVKADDGITDLYGVMYKPFDFDSTKVYPLVEYVYPGPQTEEVNSTFSAWMDRTDRLAQVGFIVITVGNRGGHPNRSKWYHTFGYGNLRDYGLADKKAAAEQLADRYSFIDKDKIGITGHSGGGFMSTAAMLVYPDFFKVAVSSSGNHENQIYNRWWSERHNGVAEKISSKGDTTFSYAIDKNTSIAGNLKGHLMLTTGDIDNNVHPANTIRMADAFIKANKRFDFVLFPGQRHGYGNMTEYFFWKMAEYFAEYLLGDSRRNEVDIMEMNREIPQKK
ncbi:MAG: S9 family peptidase [Bacteroidetes bacterium]|nr:S9 family peptidase [Bacteroidota bacterium]MBS1631099.1 S9 family peptidase [Bacteroidota bacterium]